MDEVCQVFNQKFPHWCDDCERFVSDLILAVEIVPMTAQEESVKRESSIRDVYDCLIFRGVVNAEVDVIIIDDKNFLESNVCESESLTTTEFLKG